MASDMCWACGLTLPEPVTFSAAPGRSVVVVKSLSRVRLFAAPWTAAHQASLSITNSQSSLKLQEIVKDREA